MLQILAPRWPALVRVDHFLFYLWSKRPLGSFEFQMAPNLFFCSFLLRCASSLPRGELCLKRRFSTTYDGGAMA